jgi:hypothetical protein
MPKRVIDFDAMWGSDKLAACAEWAQAEYAWLYGLADASGCFELTNLRVIWGRVAAIRKNLTIERLEQIVREFQDKGLLFVWEHEGKRYGHWTGSDVPGRLPPPSWRMRLERFAPPVPKQQLAEYMSRYARGRAALAGVSFREEARPTLQGEPSRRADTENFKCEISDLKMNPKPSSQRDEGLKPGVSENLQFEISDLKRNPGRGLGQEEDRDCRASVQNAHLSEEARDGSTASLPARACQESQVAVKFQECRTPRGGRELKDGLEPAQEQDLDWNLNWNRGGGKDPSGPDEVRPRAQSASRQQQIPNPSSYRFNSNSTASNPISGRELAVQRELRVGQGPVCGPARVREEILERMRRRDAARAGSRPP